uniref:Uncharacterized protein n=1 Tax=Arundo donax TaxID=35708 RepID=A0A0A8Z7D4_ARUDO
MASSEEGNFFEHLFQNSCSIGLNRIY